jgi:hypothetical protein
MSCARLVMTLVSGLLLIAILSAGPREVGAQTAPGDILRGEGSFLRGKGLYDLYSSQGRRIDAGTEIMIQKWNAQVYASLMKERASRYNYRKNLTNAQQEATKKRMAEKEERLRTNPTDDDIVNGDALNALLIDLSDPSIGPSAWRGKPVDLPGEISIRSLFFRFSPSIGDSNRGALANNLIAMERLDPSHGWPI